MISQTKTAATTNKCTYFTGHFDGYEDRWYNAEHIAHNSRSRAILDAIRCRDWASICPVSPRRTSWSSILDQKIELWRCENAVLKLALKRHKTDPLLSSSKQQAV